MIIVQTKGSCNKSENIGSDMGLFLQKMIQGGLTRLTNGLMRNPPTRVNKSTFF